MKGSNTAEAIKLVVTACCVRVVGSGARALNWRTVDRVRLDRTTGFAYKTTSSLYQQDEFSFAGDIGISTPDVPRSWGDCTEAETDCLAMPSGVQMFFCT